MARVEKSESLRDQLNPSQQEQDFNSPLEESIDSSRVESQLVTELDQQLQSTLLPFLSI